MSSWGSLSPAASVTLGILVGLLSTCVQSFGLTLQRKSHILEDEKLLHQQHNDDDPSSVAVSLPRPAYRRRRWQIGMTLFLLANIVGSSIQITTLPLPLLSTLQASGLVFNSLLASLILKEAWTWRTVWGTILVAAGAILISLFSALPEPSHSLGQLLVLLKMRGFLVWFALSLVFVALLLGLDFCMRKVVSIEKQESPRVHLIRGMGYGAISGVLSAHALLLAKSAVELIVRSVADKVNQFSNYRSWLLVLAFLVLALSQLYYLHLGLRLISTSILYPFVFCIYNIVAILDGLIYFRQMDRLPPLHAGLIALGTVILLAGVLALSWRLEDSPDDNEHAALAKSEIPQTVLAPGMGFVGDPDSDENNSSRLDDEDDYNDDEEDMGASGERSPLISRDDARSPVSRKSRSPFAARRRKRAATLKEVFDIWEELGDERARYGTFDDAGTGGAGSSRPSSVGLARRSRRRSSAGRSLDASATLQAEGEDFSPTKGRLQRATTMPNPYRSRSGKRRSAHGQGALFSDMLSLEWWRSRRKEADGEREGDMEGGRRSGEGEIA